MKTNKQNMTCTLLLIFAAIFFTGNTHAQVTVGADRPANSSAMLEVVSDTSGVLLPRVKLVSTTDFAPLSAHVQGMTVYNTETANDVVPGQYYNDGTRWVHTGATPWYLYGTEIDAGGNKTDKIIRKGTIAIEKTDPVGDPAGVAIQNNFWSNLSLTGINKWNRAIYSSLRPSPIEYTGTYYQLGYENVAYQQIDTLVQNNGYLLGFRSTAYREGKINGGRLESLIGNEFLYGHTTGVTGITYSATGIKVVPVIGSGFITSSYDILAYDYQGTAGNITNKYGIYIRGASKVSFLEGKLGIGTDAPSEKLHVDGAIVVGTTANATPTNGTIRFNGTNLQVYINGWKNIATN